MKIGKMSSSCDVVAVSEGTIGTAKEKRKKVEKRET